MLITVRDLGERQEPTAAQCLAQNKFNLDATVLVTFCCVFFLRGDSPMELSLSWKPLDLIISPGGSSLLLEPPSDVAPDSLTSTATLGQLRFQGAERPEQPGDFDDQKSWAREGTKQTRENHIFLFSITLEREGVETQNTLCLSSPGL